MKAIVYDEKQRKANEAAAALPGNADIYDVSLVLTDKTSPLYARFRLARPVQASCVPRMASSP